jgi:hypothetical protein
MKILISILLSAIFLSANWKSERESLDNVYILGDFRVFYTFNGEHALPSENKVDLNKNLIPDYVENIAQRLYVTKQVFTNLLGFQDPLQSKRYKNVKYIDVHIMSSEKSSAGDEIVTYKYKILDTEDKVLSIQIRNNLTKGTLTPSHEYFHILQNSHTMFKNRWYSEGTARWSESIFRKGIAKQDSLPNSQKQIEELFDKTYDTEGVFGKLTYLCDKNDGIFKNKIDLKTNIPDYPNLIEDSMVYGYEFMRVFLENLEEIDDYVSKKRGFNKFNWDEKEQKSNENNIFILKALLETINAECPKQNDEIIQFKNTIEEYVSKNE